MLRLARPNVDPGNSRSARRIANIDLAHCGLTVYQIDANVGIFKGVHMWILESGRYLRSAAERPRPRAVVRFFDWLDAKEIRLVLVQHGLTRDSRICRHAVVLNRLGNGWLYVPIALWIVFGERARAFRILTAAAASLVICHSIYPITKLFFARRRPCDSGCGLQTPCTPLDRYSFPSGHCMTACVVLLPICISRPAVVPWLAAVWCVLAWGQIACAHHYPSDLIAGGALGAIITVPICELILK